MCKAKGIVRQATVIDHIKPLALGGSDEDQNCRALCAPCPDRVTREQFGLKAPKPEIAVDGWPVDG